MWFADRIFSYVWDLSDWFYDAYQTAKDWWWPFDALQHPLYGLYQVSRSLVTPIAQFSNWTWDVWSKVQEIFSLEQITAYFRPWLDNATDAWDWVRRAGTNVWHIADDWWNVTKVTVLGWIAMATEGLDSLRASWDEFSTTTFPNLVSFTWLTTWWNNRLLDIEGLLNSAFLERDSWWAGWQDFRGKVAEFFDDPLEFLLNRFTDWFLGPEE